MSGGSTLHSVWSMIVAPFLAIPDMSASEEMDGLAIQLEKIEARLASPHGSNAKAAPADGISGP